MKKVLFLSAFLCCSAPALADFEDGEIFFEQKDYSSAFSEFLPLANEGDFRSQYYVGYLYLNGLGVTQDIRQGVDYLKKSLEQNYDMAQSLMAFLYEEGHVIPQDKEKALELYKKAAEQNNASANLNLGVFYYNGTNVEKNHKIALDYFKKVPLNEKPVAARYIGDIYLNNLELRDYASALNYYKYAASQGDLDSFFALGEIYRRGMGVPKNVPGAMTYYRYAASKGYAPAQYMLGIIYVNGEGVSRDLAKGHAWLTLGAEQKFINAEKALDQLSDMMTMADFDNARQQLVLIRTNEIDKVEMPALFVETENLNIKNQASSVKGKKRRRRGVRSRRN